MLRCDVESDIEISLLSLTLLWLSKQWESKLSVPLTGFITTRNRTSVCLQIIGNNFRNNHITHMCHASKPNNPVLGSIIV